MFVAFRLKEDRDDEIIEWLENVGDRDRSYKIREALKTYLNRASSVNTYVPLNPIATPLKVKKIVPDEGVVEANLDGWVDEA